MYIYICIYIYIYICNYIVCSNRYLRTACTDKIFVCKYYKSNLFTVSVVSKCCLLGCLSCVVYYVVSIAIIIILIVYLFIYQYYIYI